MPKIQHVGLNYICECKKVFDLVYDLESWSQFEKNYFV